MSVPYSICTEIQKKRNIWKTEKRYRRIIRKLCEQKGVEIIEAETCKDHIHLLVSIPPYLSVAQFMGYRNGKSTLLIFDQHANLKYKYGNRHFWCRGYYLDTVGRNKKVIAEYIRNQLEEDYSADQQQKSVLLHYEEKLKFVLDEQVYNKVMAIINCEDSFEINYTEVQINLSLLGISMILKKRKFLFGKID